MVEKFNPRSYQRDLIQHIKDGASSLAFVQMGLGKTASVLCAISDMLAEDAEKGLIRRWLVVAPKRVALNVWRQEAAKWDKTQHLRVGVVTGASAPQSRLRTLTDPNLDVVVINYEMLPWLCATYAPGCFPFYGLVLDESDKLKDVGSKRFERFRYRAHEFEVRIAMTGTPAPERMQDIFGTVYMATSEPLKEGALGKKLQMTSALGSSYTAFLRKHFVSDFMGYRHEPRAGTSAYIAEQIAPYVFVAKAKDHLDLPPIIYKDVKFALPKAARKIYDELEQEFLVELERDELGDDDWDDDTREVGADNIAVVRNKLRQVCSGFLYSMSPSGDRETTWIHDAKVHAYKEVVSELLGDPHIAVYGYQAEAERLQFEHRFGAGLSDEEEAEILRKWSSNQIDTLALHPASAGHGLNLHEGGARHMVFLTLPWSRGLLEQTIARLHRMGQKGSVVVVRLLAKDTVEEGVVAALESKGSVQEALIDAIKRKAA